ncbi:MAG: AsnC family transcriptional regulator [Candidatus Glassbacteria bacterium]|nr:AsnC family transcriptional regulator [Candidatus Glassbacteria bacterium]
MRQGRLKLSVSGAASLSETDRALIRILQEDLPLAAEPYAEIAGRLGLTEEEVLERVRRWCDQGVIRRFGASVRHRRVGYKANCMVVWRVDDPLEQRRVGQLFAGFERVTHCYRRPVRKDWPYNLYTMIHGADREDLDRLVAGMSEASGIGDYRLVFSVREWKKTSMKYFSEGTSNDG